MDIHKFWKDVLVQDEQEIRKYFHKDAMLIGIAQMSILMLMNILLLTVSILEIGMG